MRVLVTGAYGFIGAHIVSELVTAGHEVIAAVRHPQPAGRLGQLPAIACDMAADTRVEDWLPRLPGIDAVVNAAGILRESGRNRFDVVHRDTPCALFRACEQAGVRRVVQVSALGDPRDTVFIRSKHEGDHCLSSLTLDWVVVRPSVVYSATGSHGGTSLLRALAATPLALFLPGDGRQRLQPIEAGDLGRLIVRLVEGKGGPRQVLEAVGPESMTLEQYLQAFRQWLGIPTRLTVRVPLFLIRPLAWLGERFGRGPLGMTMYRMLQRGNTGQSDAHRRLAEVTGFAPRAMTTVLQTHPSHVQDRWHARLYLLRPLLRLSLAFLWIASGVVGLWLPVAEAARWLEPAGIPALLVPILLYTTSALDLAVGLALLLRWQVRLAGVVMLAMLLAYTLMLGWLVPSLWLEPFGGLIKNIPLMVAVLALIALEDQR